MNRQSKFRAQVALTTAICFATLATLGAGSPAADSRPACSLPAWAPDWVSGLEGDDCR